MFQINVETLPLSDTLPYLGRIIAYNNINWSTVYKNLRRWGMLARVLENTGAIVQARGAMYKAVEQSVILYSSKS